LVESLVLWQLPEMIAFCLVGTIAARHVEFMRIIIELEAYSDELQLLVMMLSSHEDIYEFH
jgi:hypothetical protein